MFKPVTKDVHFGSILFGFCPYVVLDECLNLSHGAAKMADDFGGDDPVGEVSFAPGAAGDPEAAGGHIDFEEFGTVIEIDVDRKIDGHVGLLIVAEGGCCIICAVKSYIHNLYFLILIFWRTKS